MGDEVFLALEADVLGLSGNEDWDGEVCLPSLDVGMLKLAGGLHALQRGRNVLNLPL